MRKFIIYFSLLFVLPLSYISTKNINIYKDQIVSLLNAKNNWDVTINSDIKVNFIPYPKVTIKDVDLTRKDLINIKGEVDLYFNLLEVFKKNFQLRELKFRNARINYYDKNNSHLLNGLTILGFYDQIRAVSFVDSNLVYINQQFTSREYENLNLKINLGKNISFNGDFYLNKHNINVSADFIRKDEKNIVVQRFSIGSSLFDASLGFADNIGKLTAKIKNLSKFSELYFNSSGSLFNFSSESILNITSDADITDNLLSFKNIIFDSDDFKIDGELGLNLDNYRLKNCGLNINYLNIDNLYNEKYSSQTNPADFDFILDEGGKFKLNIKSAIYHDQKIENTLIEGTSDGEKITLQPIKVKLPFDSKLELKGTISNNKYRSVFEGSVIVIGSSIEKITKWLYGSSDKLQDSKYLLYSKIYLTPAEISLTDLNLSAGNTSLSGVISKKNFTSLPKIYVNLDINNFDFDKFLPIPEWLKSFNNFRENLKKDSYLSSFQWLRVLNSETHGNLSFYNSKFNQNIIKKIGFYADASPSNLGLKNFIIDSDYLSLISNFNLSLVDLKPKIEFSSKGKVLDLKNIGKLISSDTPLDIKDCRLDRFNGKIELSFDEIISENQHLQDFSFKSNLVDNRIDISELKTKLWDGVVNLKGYVTPQTPDFGISFGLANINVENLYNFLDFPSFIQGKVSLSGSIYALKDAQGWIPNMSSNFSIALRNISLDGMDVQSIIDYSRERNNYDQSLFDKVISNATSGGKTSLDKVDGRLKITKGVMQTGGLSFAARNFTGAMAGSFDLQNKMMNSLTKINFIPRANAKVTPIIVKLKGNFANPEKSIDTHLLSDFLKAN